jgi:flavin-dependent thymidylate synthase
MKVTLLTATPDALDVLLYTKNTRLSMTGTGLAEVKAWPAEKKAGELRYMKNTIQSSWEFVDYVFAIEGVTRAFTHQLVRHRVGTSFAQQAQRVVNMEGFGYLATGALSVGNAPSESYQTRYASLDDLSDRLQDLDEMGPVAKYEVGMDIVNAVYSNMIADSVEPQDARGILPTNILTNIVFKANLRTLHEMGLKRLCVKAQGEFQDVFRAIVDEVARLHPWAEEFIRVQCAWNGTCLFPSLPVEQCHVKGHVYDAENAQSYGAMAGLPERESYLATTHEIYQLHRSKRTEIQPTITTDPAGID